MGIAKLNELINLIDADGNSSPLLDQLMIAPDEALSEFVSRINAQMKTKMSFEEAQSLLAEILSSGEDVKGEIEAAKTAALSALAGDVAAASASAKEAGAAASAALNRRFAGKYHEDASMNLYSGDSVDNTGTNGNDVATGKCNAILNSGGGNEINGDHNLVSGALNTVEAENCITVGLGNHAKLVKKEVNGAKHTYGHRAALFGRYLISNANDQTWVGRWNVEKEGVIFGVGAGTAEKRFNAFVVYPKGTAAVGHDPIGDMDVSTKRYVDRQIGNVSEALDAIIAMQESFIGGDAV